MWQEKDYCPYHNKKLILLMGHTTKMMVTKPLIEMIMKTFKNIIQTLLLLAVLLVACSPQEDPKPSIGKSPQSDDITFTFTYDAENPNIVHFTNTTPFGFKAVWDFDNGASATGNQVIGQFPLQGAYTVKLTVYDRSGSAHNTKMVNIAETNPLMLDIPSYNFLTGGVDAIDGKTWIVDKEVPAHLGVGPGPCCPGDDQNNPIWYAAAPFEKEGRNYYDDEMTFKLSGFTYIHNVGDYFYANGGYGSLPGAIQEPGGGDFFVPHTPPAVSNWSLTDNGGGTYTLTVSNGEFLGYYHGATSYRITYLTENEMHVRSVDPNASIAWYQKFIRKGYTRPVIPPPYKIENIFDTFDTPGNVTYTNDAGGGIAEDYDNPAPFDINTSAKVARYTKGNGEGAAFSNVQILLDYKMDIRERNKFKMKVFIPSYNDYTTIGAYDWQAYNTLQKMVSLKLQNSELGGNGWTTQAEVAYNNLETNQWIELTFDFSAVADRTDFDKIVIQFGGEANFTGGIFFFDDLLLLP
jgi:hypothetical protein